MYRVMLADDEPIVRKALQILPDWKGLDCEIVYTASNGNEALKRLPEISPDILITDIRMPGADGIALAKYIWENRLPVKVIILTAYADFSYAQSAIRYDVVEYITKTGILDGLETAVEKCKAQLKQESGTEKRMSASMAAENLFRAVYDGSLYEEEEIENRAAELGLSLKDYRVLLFHIRIQTEVDRERKQRIHNKMEEFLEEAFEARMVKNLFVKRDMLCVVLNSVPEGERGMLTLQLQQITELMEGFCPVLICTGVSDPMSEIRELKKACRQAGEVLEAGFLDERDKVNFYSQGPYEKEVILPEADGMLEAVCREIQKGDAGQATQIFRELFRKQKEAGCPAASIKNTGMSIQSRCRKLLMEYENTDFGSEVHPNGITQQIYGCMYSDEYESILLELIKHTTQVTGTARNRKNDIIAECLNYIDSHYMKAVSVPEMAEHIGINASYLSRVFKETTGNTIIATINSKKLEKAKEYLEQRNWKIYEIAEALGFENVTYFSHFFKKQTGTSPKDWVAHKKDGGQ